jgi:phosphatidylserine/phosphatidylglycerophosphate/cardiolipin synthase-like enzyme/uncharacterized membrane protein YdjX (TVP38/TMEM64 family)
MPGRNVWRTARADRAVILVDGAAYFLAVRKALMKAQRSIYIIGWDISSQTRLVGPSGKAEDGWPETLVDFLMRLTTERPALDVYILVWDYSVIYTAQRELLPSLSLGWSTPRRVRFCNANDLPIGSSHHQKLIVIDDAIAFCGGLDLTARRWDTCEHPIAHPCRVDPAGEPYPPFHDVQMLVDGPAAQALAALARTRWEDAWEASAPDVSPHGDPWPGGVEPHFHTVEVGLSRTVPRHDGNPEVREVEALFHDAIAAADREIYIENQFLTTIPFAERLIERMRERPQLEVLMVTSRLHDSWIVTQTLGPATARFAQTLSSSDVADRVRIVNPEVCDGERTLHTTVHSKVMVVDDRLLRVGSANLNNRSMGADTECDLAIEGSDREREAIRNIRDRLLADHCGVSGEAAARAIERTGSLIGAAEQLSGNGHRLRPARFGPSSGSLVVVETIADPDEPLGAEDFISAALGERPPQLRFSKLTKLAIFLAALIALSLAWLYTPLASFAQPDYLRAQLRGLEQAPFAPLVIVGGFLILELVAFPITLLIAATAAAFGPWLGFLYAALGVLASALSTYAVGALLGQEALRGVLGKRMQRVRRAISRRGVLAIAAIRLVPIAPFAVVNAAAGALRVRLADFLYGTAIGMAPGLLLMSAIGHQAIELLIEPSITTIALLLLGVLTWIGLAFAAQTLVARYRRGIQ